MRLAPRLSPEPLYVFENNGENGIHLRLRAIVSWLNPTCNCCVRFATTVATGHATLAAKGYSLLGPDFHRLDRTSLRLAHVAVGTRVSSRAPRTEPYGRLSRIRLPPRVYDGNCLPYTLQRL